MCNDSSSPQPCNRRPFASDDGCDRGNVDISQFNDLPYCGKIDPTMPEIPPEVQDGPVPIPLPAYNCTCFNIDYKFDLKYNENRTANSFSTSAHFAAMGDCCEGRYETNFKLRIPCPVKNKDGGKIKVGISYGNGPQSDSASFIFADSSNCTIEPIGANIRLNIPCPILGIGEQNKIRASVKYGDGPAEQSAVFMATNAEKCTIEGKSPVLDLNIRCPVQEEGNGAVYAGVDYGVIKKTDAGNVVQAIKNGCSIIPRAANLSLNIPCPIKIRRKNGRLANVKGIDGVGTRNDPLGGMTYSGPIQLRASVKFNDDNPVTTAYAPLASITDGCQLEVPEEANLELAVPCPVSKRNLNIETTADGPGGLSIVADDESGDCGRTIHLHASFPPIPSFDTSGENNTFCAVTGISYNERSHQLRYLYSCLEIRKGVVKKVANGTWITVFTAVKHSASC